MKYLAALALLVAAATASPTDMTPRSVTPAELTKRDTEIVYLANCRQDTTCCPEPPTYSSSIYYYGASADANAGKQPANGNQCPVVVGGLTTWEGSARSCTFPTGVTFTSHIQSNGQSVGNFQYAGWGSNPYKTWKCYKDNGHQLFKTSFPEWQFTCYSIYYCLPA